MARPKSTPDAVVSVPEDTGTKMSILNNPYLDQEQKDLLIKTGLAKILNTSYSIPKETIAVKYTAEGVDRWYILECHLTQVQKAWQFYKENSVDPNFSEFVARIKPVLGAVTLLGDKVSCLEFD